ncbi:hypothetical protein AMAG_07598 [Allomyces macrogynus ATCC 38327]|uniref:G-protein coupled receptors family 3 profile domain-containing protein n=1 Tax=Allomyces macrogynus (strain ATCC 38327) TaxID=578462 RepID=A0A0L0SIV5_ALLM3|nr:hypothetical protein AMAG_07598 [Allomyces macrogynus ATCC 38327]|eukprot:KNE62374.1 hypothetical protein AMAG_07598 [Allomyces macrogynus ATCC 38327]
MPRIPWIVACARIAAVVALAVLHFAAAPVTAGTPMGASMADLMAPCRACHRRSEVKVGIVSHGDWVRSVLWGQAAKGIAAANALYNISAYPIAPVLLDIPTVGRAMATTFANFSLAGTSVLDPTTMIPIIQRGTANGTKIISFNTGDFSANVTGVLHHVGQPEYASGFKVGLTLARLGKGNLLCINHVAGHAGMAARCQGVTDGAQSVNSSAIVTTTIMDGTSVTALDAGITAALTNIVGLDCMVGLGALTGVRMATVVGNAGRLSSVTLVTYDFNTDVLTAVAQGKLLFTVDQQGFLQTFVTAQLLKLYHMTGGMKLSTLQLLSGPNFVTTSNVFRRQCQLNSTLTGCTRTAPSSITIGLVATWGWLTDMFYQQAKFGAQAAAAEHGVNLRFIDTNIYDLQSLSLQISTVISQGISALVLPVPSTASGQNFPALIDAAAAANIPVMTWATGQVRGSDKVQAGHALLHIGQNETASGQLVGARLNALMPANSQVLCLTQELGNEDMPLKCAGIQAALTNGRTVALAGPTVAGSPLQPLTLGISVRNTLQSQNDIQAALAAFPQVSAIIYPTVEAAGMVMNALAGVSAARAAAIVAVAGYGMSTDVAELIRVGKIAFTVNEQPYLQGYLAVASLSLWLTEGYVLQNPLLETGPVIVDQSNLAQAVCNADATRDPGVECPPCPTKCTINGICLDSGACACKSGWLLGPALDCQLRDPGLQYIATNSGVAIAFMSLSVLGMFVAVGLSVFLFIYRANPIVKATSWTISVGMQIGILIVLASIFVNVGAPTATSCVAMPFVLSIGFSTVLGLLVAKTRRIFVLFNSIKLKGLKVSDLKVMVWGLAMVVVNVILCIIWAVIDPPRPTNQFISEGVTNVVCASSNPATGTAIGGVLIAYNVLLILAGTVIAFITRGVQAKFNESRQIGGVMYNLIALAAIGVPLLLSSSSNVTLSFAVESVIVFLGAMSTEGILFGPKVMGIINEKTGSGDQTISKIVMPKWSQTPDAGGKTARKRAITRGLLDTTDTTTTVKATMDTLTLRTGVRIVRGKMDAITAMWFNGVVLLFSDPKLAMLNVVDMDRPGHVGYSVDLTQALVALVASEGHGSQVASSASPIGTASADSTGSGSGAPAAAGILKITTPSNHKIFIQMPTGAAMALWSGTLDKICGYSAISSRGASTAKRPAADSVSAQGSTTIKTSAAAQSDS